MKRLSKPLIAVIVTLIVALVAGMVSAVWIIMTPLTAETGSSFRPDNIEEKVTISFNYGEFSEVSGYPANQEAHAPIEAIAGQEITLPTGDKADPLKEGIPTGYGLSAWQSSNGVHYEPGQKCSFEASVTMTPVWAKVVTVTFVSEGHENRQIDIEAGASFSDTLAYKSAEWPEDMEKTTVTDKAFSGWFDSVGVQYTNTTVFNDSVELTAKFKLTKLPKLYFGLVGDGATNAPIKVTEKLAKNASRLLFSQDKEQLYNISSSSSTSSFTATESGTGSYTKFEREIYLYVNDHFDIIGTTEDDDAGPLFTDYTHQQRSGYVPKFYVASGGVAISGVYNTEYKATSAGYYKITLYVPYSSRTKWDDTAYVRFDRVSTESAPATSTHQLYIRGTHNGWLNDWPWGSFDITKANTTYTNSVYNFNKFKAPTVSGNIYTYTYDITLKQEDLTSGNFQFKAYDANVLVWLGLEDSSKGTLSPSSSTGVSKDTSSANSGNIIISKPGIWEIKIALTVSNGSPTKWTYTIMNVSCTVDFSYGAGYDGETPPAERVVKSGDELTLPGAPARAGYKFDGWKSSIATDSTRYQQGDPYKVTADVTFTAQWTPLITVTYTDPEFPDRVTTHQYVEAGHSADYTAPDASTWPVGRTFAGWHVSYDKDTGWGDYYRGEPIDGDTTLYAKWDYIEYTVKFASSINDATLAGMPTGEYKVSLKEPTLELSKIENPTLTGYTFSHWTFGDEIAANLFTLTEDDVKNMVEGSTELTLTAQWNPITYKIIFDGNKPDTQEEILNLDDSDTVYVTREAGKDEIRLPVGYMKNDKVDYEQGVWLRGYTLRGWNLQEWLTDGSLHSPLVGMTWLDTDMIDAAVEQGGEHVITFFAEWQEGNLNVEQDHQHTISYSFNSYGGVVYPLEEERKYHTDTDWDQWNDTLYWHSKDASKDQSKQKIAPAPHWAGFTFEYWDYRDYAYILGLEGAKHQYNAGDPFTIDEFDGPQITFDAIWSPITYTIKFETNIDFLTENGAVGPAITGFGGESIQMTRLDSVVLESINTKGFTFKGWEISTCDASGAESTVTINPGDAFTISTAMIAFANKGHTDDETELTLTAQWEKTSYDVVFLTNGHGTAPAATSLTWGEAFEISEYTITDPASDYEFQGWKLNGTGETIYGAGAGQTATYTMSYAEIPESDLYYIVYFVAQWNTAAKEYTITFASSITISASMPDPLKNLAEGNKIDFTSSTIGDSDLYKNDYKAGSTTYRFLGWSLTQSAKSGILYTTRDISTEMPTNVDFTKQTEYTVGGEVPDITFYAIWTQVYTITFNMNGGLASQAPASQSGVYGKTYSLPSVTRTDYIFKGWKQGSSTSSTVRAEGFTWEFGKTNATTPLTFYASWEEDLSGWYLVGQTNTKASITGIGTTYAGALDSSNNAYSSKLRFTKSGSTYTLSSVKLYATDIFQIVYRSDNSTTVDYSVTINTPSKLSSTYFTTGGNYYTDVKVKDHYAGYYTFKVTGTTASASVTVTKSNTKLTGPHSFYVYGDQYGWSSNETRRLGYQGINVAGYDEYYLSGYSHTMGKGFKIVNVVGSTVYYFTEGSGKNVDTNMGLDWTTKSYNFTVTVKPNGTNHAGTLSNGNSRVTVSVS